jgi:predicted RNase H-like nuclease
MRRTGFRRRNKFGAIKTKKDGIMFDSKLEASWYEYLKILGAAGQVKDLELQKEFTLYVKDKQICTYIADYFYFDPAKDKWVVGDAKGVVTDVFRLKWKMMQAIYPDYHYQIFKGKPFR